MVINVFVINVLYSKIGAVDIIIGVVSKYVTIKALINLSKETNREQLE